MAIYNRDFLSVKHDLYKENISNWEFYIRSYLGGNDYKNGYHLHRYILETPEEYEQRIRHTPIDNHCLNVIQIYSSFLWRVPPSRDYGSLTGDPQLQSFADALGVMSKKEKGYSEPGEFWLIENINS